MKEKKKSFLYFCCDFCGCYNFEKIIEILATKCNILKLKCTKFDFGCGSAPDPAGRTYSAAPDPFSWIKGA